MPRPKKLKHLHDYAHHEVTLSKRGPRAKHPKRIKANPAQHIPRAQLIEVRNAFLFADKQVMTLNTFVTINYRDAKGPKGWCPGFPPAKQVRGLRERINRSLRGWCDEQKNPAAWVYALENIPYGGKGTHIHMLMHLDPERWAHLRAALRSRLIHVMGRSETEIARMERRQARSTPGQKEAFKPFDISEEMLPKADALVRLRYLCKGASPDEIVFVDDKRQTLLQLARLKGLNPAVTLQRTGNVYSTKRAGSSQLLSQSARRSDGWVDDTDLTWLSRFIEREKLKAESIEMQREWFAKAVHGVPAVAVATGSGHGS